MREGKCELWFWELLTFVVYDSRMLPPQSNSLASSNSSALKRRDEQVLEKNHSPP